MNRTFFLQLLLIVLSVVTVGQLAVLPNLFGLWTPYMTSIERYRSAGAIALLSERIEAVPLSAREALLDELQNDFGYYLGLRDLEQASLTQSQRLQLMAGLNVFNKQTHEIYHILSHQQLLVLSNIDVPRKVMSSGDTLGLTGSITLMERALMNQPQARWDTWLEEVKGSTSFPITLAPLSTLKLPPAAINTLKQGKLHGVQTPLSKSYELPADLVYKRIGNSEIVLVLGPIAQVLDDLRNDRLLQYYSILAFIIFVPITLWLIPAWCSSRRLRQASKEFGEGNLDTRLPIHAISGFKPLEYTFNRMAEDVQKLFTKNRILTHAISHDLRTPLTNLEFSIALFGASDSVEHRQKMLKRMNDTLTNINGMVTELDTFAKLDQNVLSIDRHAVNVNQFIVETCEKWLNGAEGIQISVTPWRHQLEASIDIYYMERVLDNLIRNALSYAKKRIHVFVEPFDQGVKIMVDNDGPLIPEIDKVRVFEPFVRLDESRNRDSGGTGLGLAIVKHIVDAHDGHVHAADSALGARFVIELSNSTSL